MVIKVNVLDTSGLFLKTQYNTDKFDLEEKIDDADKKIPDICELIKKADCNAKITDNEGKFPSITA